MATTPKLSSKGDQLDLEIRQLASFGPHEVTATGSDGLPLNLTGCTFRGQIRRKPTNTPVVVAFTFNVLDAVNGVFEFSLSVSDTNISAGNDQRSSESKYVWAMDLIDSTGRVIPLLYGDVEIQAAVARP